MLRGLVNKDKKIGWTLHDIDTGIDTGCVIKEIPFFNYNKKDGMISILGSTVKGLAQGWIDFIDQEINQGNVERHQQTSKGNYFTYPTAKEFDYWYNNGHLAPLVAKEMVKFYYDLFISPNDKFKEVAQNFKVTMINKVARFETMIELSKDTESQDIITPQKTAA